MYFDEDVVFEAADAIEQHRKHVKHMQWSKFKIVFQNVEPENKTITFAGHNGNDSFILLDDVDVTIKSDQSGQ